MIRFLNIGCVVFLFAGSAVAQMGEKPSFERALRLNSGLYDATSKTDLDCYAVTDSAVVFDLSRICWFTQVGSDGGVQSVGGSGGRCDRPDDIARDGSRCGRRSASDRPGGR